MKALAFVVQHVSSKPASMDLRALLEAMVGTETDILLKSREGHLYFERLADGPAVSAELLPSPRSLTRLADARFQAALCKYDVIMGVSETPGIGSQSHSSTSYLEIRQTKGSPGQTGIAGSCLDCGSGERWRQVPNIIQFVWPEDGECRFGRRYHHPWESTLTDGMGSGLDGARVVLEVVALLQPAASMACRGALPS